MQPSTAYSVLHHRSRVPTHPYLDGKMSIPTIMDLLDGRLALPTRNRSTSLAPTVRLSRPLLFCSLGVHAP